MDKHYSSALKQGQKSYRSCMSKGEYPYLPVLDDLIPEEKSLTANDIGIVQVPAEFIIGTKTAGRTRVFARNFMPIAEDGSEFASKWERLCAAHLEEGIREPILVYEYMNRFYVEEGNKRASVLKYFDAVTIPARVKRIMPEMNGDISVKIYYEFVEFYKRSKINFIEFSKLGCFKELQNALGKEMSDNWTEEENKKFRSVYYYFRKAYESCGGSYLKSTVGDAMLAYIRIYGYGSLQGLSEKEMKNKVSKVWEEITLQQEEKPIDVKLNPEDDKVSLLSIFTGSKKLKIAFLYGENAKQSSWVYAHELGRQHVQNVFRGQIDTVAYECLTNDQLEDVLQKIASDKVNVIFATTSEMMNTCLRFAIDHPEIEILNCSINKPHRYIRSYYIRMYEAKFITGAIAGALCRNDKIGYICKYPIYGTIAEINAFARGVQLTNPEAKVYLEWSSKDSTREATKRLRNQGIELISFRDFVKLDGSEKQMFGLEKVTDNGLTHLALPVWNWGVFYERIIRMMLNGTYRNEDEKTSKSLNYYWGMSSGASEMIFSERLPKGVRYLGEVLVKAICDEHCKPFYNPTIAENGKILWETHDQSIRMEEIMGMDWLEENIVGSIPEYDELEQKVKDVVNTVGVQPARKDAKEKG